MKKSVLPAVFVILLTLFCVGCSQKTDSSLKDTFAEGTNVEDTVSKDAGTEKSTDEIRSDSYMGNISDIEYAFILCSFRDQVISDLTYTCSDVDSDGDNELLINAITDEKNGMHTQFLADANEKSLYNYWGYTPTGAAESSNYCTMDGYDTILWNTDFSTTDFDESKYYKWTGNDWEEIKELDNIAFDYKNAAAFDSPDVLNIEISGDSKTILSEVNTYFEERDGAFSVGAADLDSDGQKENVYYVLRAATDWYEKLVMGNTTENQSFQDHQDPYMTVVVADETEDGVVLRPVRVHYRGTDIKIEQNKLYIDDTAYIYSDRQSQYSNPCLQTEMNSPGTYGSFDSLGNRTISGMLQMPFYDVSKMCTNISLYENDPAYVTAALRDSRCTFEFMPVTDSGSLSAAAPAYIVEVQSWNLEKDKMAIDEVPLTGDFSMGDTIGELRTIMVPSTEWSPLLCGQDFLAHTSFYYRPSYENTDVYYVKVWTDSEGENSKVCGIRFEECFEFDNTTKTALGLH